MLLPASFALRGISGKQYNNGMKIRARQPPHPVLWVVVAGSADNLRAGSHTLTKLLRKCGKRRFIDAENSQAVPGKGHTHPSGVRVVGLDSFCSANFF